ncbi:hypothetical protein JK628_02780 [Shewanella sp. KX20019]|uniref:hypothetical protein n=1 Tax=Shewanella sp. KX20019 TaxID=2803864 RepID=UPI0019281A96|nr:hypothetical protein [Shewanella sp. KX20019]QQX80814.1 hypothetical protein JK628_02780 [Shewanella sp. KX20019]
MNLNYILIGKNPVCVGDDFFAWSNWMGWAARNNARHVGDYIQGPQKPIKKGNKKMLGKINHFRSEAVRVSTVFLGLDHNWYDNGKPIIFETMVFGGIRDGAMIRYRTWDDAKVGHDEMVDAIKKKKLF